MENSENREYLVHKVKTGSLKPIELLKKLPGSRKFLLESTVPHEKKGKYSFLGMDPYQEIIGHEDRTTVIDRGSERIETVDCHALEYVKSNLPKLDADIPLPFYGGAVGYIGYDSIRQFENVGEPLHDEINMPDIHFMVYKDLIIFDHTSQEIYLVAINPESTSESPLEQRIQRMQQLLGADSARENEMDFSPVPFLPQTSKEDFMKKVEIAKEHIRRGDIFQVVLSQRMVAMIDENPDFAFSFYRRLREANPSPYMFYIDFEDYLLLGASPESLIQTSGSTVVTNPIAGTRPRGSDPEEDRILMEELLNDTKEIAEHRMLVDLSRNDLGRVCEIGSITIPTYMTIEKYQHVMHIVSEVQGQLKQGHSGLDALISSLPAGTVSGAPKIRAMQIINSLEDKKRGVYAGGIGYINFNHDLNIALAIRSLVIREKKAYLQAGAGIVYDSVPEKEYEETLNKARSLMEVQQLDPVNR